MITKTPRITAIRTLLKLVDLTNQSSYLPRDLPTIRTQRAMRVRGSNSTNSSNIETVLKNTRKRVHSSRSRRTSTPSLMITAISQAMASSISRMRASLIKTISSTTNHHWFRLPLTSSTRRATTRCQTISTLSLPASSLINTKRSPLFSRLTQPHLTQMLLTSNPNLSTLRGSETTND